MKKEYIEPQVTIIVLSATSSLLTGSRIVTVEEGEWGEGTELD